MSAMTGEDRVELACGHVVWRCGWFASFYWEAVVAAKANNWPCPICHVKGAVTVTAST